MWGLWAVAGLVAIIYCVATSVMHFRQKRYVWAALGFATAFFIASAPIGVETPAVKIDLPA